MKILHFILFIVALGCLAAFGPGVAPKKAVKKQPQMAPATQPAKRAAPRRDALVLPQPPLDVAVFAGGCFWCMESAFEKVPGVFSVISGYTGGPEERPAYADVASGKTGHQEAVWVVFHSEQINFANLLEVFWQNIDPTQGNGQFADLGPQYLSSIFVRTSEQRESAMKSMANLKASKKFAPLKIATTIKSFDKFWPAESYHQDYYRLHPEVYDRYYEASGRGPFIRQHWGASQGKQK